MVIVLILALVGGGSVPMQDGPRCLSLTYDSLSQYANVRNFPSTLTLRRSGAGRGLTAVRDTAGKWGTPLEWNTYRERGDSITVWLADGYREVRIAGRFSQRGLEGHAEVQTDVAGIQLAHVAGELMRCQVR